MTRPSKVTSTFCLDAISTEKALAGVAHCLEVVAPLQKGNWKKMDRKQYIVRDRSKIVTKMSILIF